VTVRASGQLVFEDGDLGDPSVALLVLQGMVVRPGKLPEDRIVGGFQKATNGSRKV